jgi:hypothetical protein
MKWRGRISQHGHARDLRYGFFQKLQPLHARFREQQREARYVPAGPRQARDETPPTASALDAITIGVVEVARIAARVASVTSATNRSTLS